MLNTTENTSDKYQVQVIWSKSENIASANHETSGLVIQREYFLTYSHLRPAREVKMQKVEHFMFMVHGSWLMAHGHGLRQPVRASNQQQGPRPASFLTTTLHPACLLQLPSLTEPNGISSSSAVFRSFYCSLERTREVSLFFIHKND